MVEEGRIVCYLRQYDKDKLKFNDIPIYINYLLQKFPDTFSQLNIHTHLYNIHTNTNTVIQLNRKRTIKD